MTTAPASDPADPAPAAADEPQLSWLYRSEAFPEDLDEAAEPDESARRLRPTTLLRGLSAPLLALALGVGAWFGLG
jgi:hypothetical protein